MISEAELNFYTATSNEPYGHPVSSLFTLKKFALEKRDDWLNEHIRECKVCRAVVELYALGPARKI